MRISAKSVLFLRILRLLVVARKSSREKSSDDAFHSFFVSFGLKHFASLLYTQKDKYNLHTLPARSKAKNERYGDAFFVRCDDDDDDAIVFVEHRVVVFFFFFFICC